jgi:hypothetical protein
MRSILCCMFLACARSIQINRVRGSATELVVGELQGIGLVQYWWEGKIIKGKWQ